MFFVKNIKKSKTFYEKILKQEVLVDFGRYIGFVGNFGLWQEDFAIKSIFSTTKRIQGQRNYSELSFECAEIEKFFEILQKEDIEFIHPIREQPWGQLVFRFYDPDRNILEIGEPLSATVLRLYKKGKLIDHIAEITTLHRDEIEKILKAHKEIG